MTLCQIQDRGEFTLVKVADQRINYKYNINIDELLVCWWPNIKTLLTIVIIITLWIFMSNTGFWLVDSW